jgi:hypothetical protein
MTYNFDPERWYQNELAALQRRHAAGDITAPELESAVAELDRKLEEMWQRLDGSYRLPPT